jgi:hypothetical protein
VTLDVHRARRPARGAHGGRGGRTFFELLAAGELAEAVGAGCGEHDDVGAAVVAVRASVSQPDRWAPATRPVLDLLAEFMWREETDVFAAAALALSAVSLGAVR